MDYDGVNKEKLNKECVIEIVSEETFSRFGKIIEFSQNSQEERFEVIISEDISPWRIAMLRVRQRSTSRLECHPHSIESFEPISGFGLLLVAEHDSPSKIEIFALDKPICLNPRFSKRVTISENKNP